MVMVELVVEVVELVVLGVCTLRLGQQGPADVDRVRGEGTVGDCRGGGVF